MTLITKLIVLLFLVGSLQGWSKTNPYDAETVGLISSTFFDNGGSSVVKISAYEDRMSKKIFEISHIIETEARRSGETDENEIADKVKDADSIIALNQCLSLLKKMKTETRQEVLLKMGHDVLDLEGAVRIEGASNALAGMIEQVENFLGVWTVPYVSPLENEASNLYEPISKSFLGSENMRNLDLSQYDPDPASSFWKDPGVISDVDMKKAGSGALTPFYKGADLSFPEKNHFKFKEMKYSDTKPKMDVTYKDANGKKYKYKLKVGAEIHADPTLAAFTMALGFGADVTKYVRNVRVDLGKKYNLSDLKRDWEIYFKRDNTRAPFKIEDYIKESGKDENGSFVIFKEGLLEAKPADVARLGGWSFKELGNENLRELRGLTLIQMWLDNTDLKEFDNNQILARNDETFHIISDLGKGLGGMFGEKPELVHDNMISSLGRDGLKFNYRGFHTVGIKNKMTFADARWAARLIGSLSKKQIEDGMNMGQWPACLSRIYVEKLISRRNDLLVNLDLMGQKDRSGKILAPIARVLTEDEMNFDTACSESDLQDSTIDFDFSTRFLTQPIYKSALNKLMDLATSSINSTRTVSISNPDFELQTNVISQIIFDLRREIELNPHPKSEEDIYIVRDHFEVGMRLGVSFGLYKDFIYTRSYSLAYPARTKEEARLNNGFIVNVVLPRDIHRGNLPKKYVLHTDHFFQSGTGVDVDDLGSPVSISLRAKVSRARILRSILDRRDEDKIVVYRDRTDYSEAYLRAFLRVAIIKLPLFTTFSQWGSASGAGAIITKTDLDKDPKLQDGLYNAVVSGDFSGLKQHEEDFFIQNRFESKNFNWSFIFWNGQTSSRLDRISIDREGDNDEDLLQYRTDRSRSWNFFGRSEKKTVTAEVLATPDQKSYQLKLKIGCIDTSTKDQELEGNYLFFINGLSVTGERIIPFTPSLGYTTNGKWGALQTRSETTYYREGIDRILGMNDQDLWKAVGQSFGVRFNSLLSVYQEAKNEMRSSDANQRDSILQSYGIKTEDFELLSHTEEFLKGLRDVRDESTNTKKIKKIGMLFRKTAYKHRAGFFEPRLIGSLNRLAGLDNIYSMNIITSPPFKEVNMIEGKPLFGEIGKARPDEQGYLNYVPSTPLEQYNLFNNWRIL